MSEHTATPTNANSGLGGSGSGPSASRLKILSRGDACWSCRRRKLRCDGGKPICGPCRRYQRPHECVFDEKPLTEVQMLEARVTELEAQLQRTMGQGHSQDASVPRFSQQVSASATPASLAISSIGFAAEPPEFPRPDMALVPNSSAEGVMYDMPIGHEVTDALLEVFFRHLCHFNFAVDIDKFRRALQLPQNNPYRPHPALLNAIYCIACHYAEGTTTTNGSNLAYSQLEPIFHDRAQRHLDDSLAHVDRLFDFLAATTLLAQYNLIKGNLAKGSYLASSAMSFAIGCGLHQLNVRDAETHQTGNVLLPPAENLADYLERINVFSTVFQIERQTCLESGVPLNLADELITTPWPIRPNQQSIPPEAFQPSLASLFLAGSPAASVRGDTVLAVRAKAIALLERATRQARYASLQHFSSAADGRFWESYQSLDQALLKFRESLPPINQELFTRQQELASMAAGNNAIVPAPAPDMVSELAYPDQFTHGIVAHNAPPNNPEWLNFTLTFAHVSSAAAVIQLHGIFAERDESEAAVVLAAARDVARIVRVVGAPRGTTALMRAALGLEGGASGSGGTGGVESPSLVSFEPRQQHKLVGYGIAVAAHALHREWRRRSLPPSSLISQVARDIKVEFDMLKKALGIMTQFYPGLQTYYTDILQIDA